MSPASGATALKQYQDVIAELQAMAAVTPTDQLEASLIADTEFQTGTPTTSTEAMIARLNIVDGIFAEQVGVLIVPSEIRLLPAGNPLNSSDAETLLDQLATYRETTPAVASAGLAHLMTGKILGGNTLGIAYIDALCDHRYGAGLSSSSDIVIGNAIVMAHELGHNFGAEHDGVAGGACESTPDNFLMSPHYTGNIFFSQCSRDTIAPKVAVARGICITPANYADLSVTVPSPITGEVNATFSVPVTVHAMGNRNPTNVTLEVDLAPSMSLQGVVSSDTSCAMNGVTVSCILQNVTAGEDRVVELQLESADQAQFHFMARADADNDYLIDNNQAQFDVNVSSAVDLGLQMSVDHGTVYMTDPFEITLDVTSMRGQVAHGARPRHQPVQLRGRLVQRGSAYLHDHARQSRVALRARRHRAGGDHSPHGARAQRVHHVRLHPGRHPVGRRRQLRQRPRPVVRDRASGS
jgi:hypothetical protein